MEKRIITTDVTEEDFSLEGNLRPQTLDGEPAGRFPANGADGRGQRD